MTTLMDSVKTMINSLSESSDTETTENLLDLKKELAEQIVEKLEVENSDFILSMGRDVVIDYLVEEWWTDKIHDAVVEQGLDAFLPSLASELKERREKLKEASTEAELQRLKAEITNRNESLNANNLSSSEQSTTEDAKENATSENDWIDSWNVSTSDGDVDHHSIQLASLENMEEQMPYIQAVLDTAASQIGKPYVWGGATEDGFDCSGLWNWTFQKQGLQFEQRFTASLFSQTDINIGKEDIRIWDFMYWDKKLGSKKHNPIYHIEMVVGKPFYENGKYYVKTLGSSTDTGVLNAQWKKTSAKGVGYRLREITDYRHFGRPPYYSQLAEHQKTGDKHSLIAKVNPSDRDTTNGVTA